MKNNGTARIAILGIAIESNRFAPVSDESSFRDYAWCEGREILESRVIDYWIGSDEKGGFVGRMNQLRPWAPVPILVADAQAGGPCDHRTYLTLRDRIVRELQAQMPLDAVYIVGHGAGITTEIDDLDGDYFRAVRRVVGKSVPIVATLDLHGNVSDAMVEATDALVAQRTNPHVDSTERAEEAAELIHRLLEGERFFSALVRLPLVTPQVTQLTAPGTPYGDLIEAAGQEKSPPVVGFSILAGFAFSDTPYNGMAVYAVGREEDAVRRFTNRMALLAWADRHRYAPRLITVEEAVLLAKTCEAGDRAGPIILADVGDNPGGGGSGNTMWLIEACYQAGIRRVLVGIVHAPEVVTQAKGAGEGSMIEVVFNERTSSKLSRPFAAKARILRVCSGDYLSTVGVYRGSVVPLGLSCVLEIGGLRVVVVTKRQQLFGPDCFEHFGLDWRGAAVIIVKSRGHFRAGFKGEIPGDRIHEVDAPGLTTPNLSQIAWRNLPRPVYPLDEEAHWP